MGTIELPAGTTVDRLHWPTADRILASLWGEQPQVAALQPGARKPIAVHDLDGMILKSSPAGDGLAILLAPTDGIGQAKLALFDGDEVRYVDLPGVRAGLGRVRRAGGLPRPPARAGPRGRPFGKPRRRHRARQPGGRGRPREHDHDLARPRPGGLSPRALPQLARAGRLGEDDRRPGVERRLAPDRPDRAQRRDLHDRRRLGARDSGGPCARRPRQLERSPRQRRAGLGDAARRRLAGLCVERGLGRARRCTSSAPTGRLGSRSSGTGRPISPRSPASTSTSGRRSGLTPRDRGPRNRRDGRPGLARAPGVHRLHRVGQTSSRSASPWPPPEQMAASPSPPPLRRSS